MPAFREALKSLRHEEMENGLLKRPAAGMLRAVMDLAGEQYVESGRLGGMSGMAVLGALF
jgi:hypothetical protein